MAATTERRLAALEAQQGNDEQRFLIVVRFAVSPGHLDAEPVGIEAAPPYLPAVDRALGESWDAFTARLCRMLSLVPAGHVVRVVTRANPNWR